MIRSLKPRSLKSERYMEIIGTLRVQTLETRCHRKNQTLSSTYRENPDYIRKNLVITTSPFKTPRVSYIPII